MFVALVIRHSMHMCCIVICGLPAECFPHYLINGTVFENKHVIEDTVCVLIFCTTLSATNISHSKED